MPRGEEGQEARVTDLLILFLSTDWAPLSTCKKTLAVCIQKCDPKRGNEIWGLRLFCSVWEGWATSLPAGLLQLGKPRLKGKRPAQGQATGCHLSVPLSLSDSHGDKSSKLALGTAIVPMFL